MVGTDVMKTVKLLPLALGIGLALLLAGCEPGNKWPWAGTGAYPLDYFAEMHYQPSYRAQEPARLYPPAQSVPTTGREVAYTAEQAARLANPVPRNAASLEAGKKLYDVNCAMCHGQKGLGDGTVAAFFKAALSTDPTIVVPADYTAPAIVSQTDGQLFYTLTDGKARMPGFGKLLTPQERWALVNYIRSLQGK